MVASLRIPEDATGSLPSGARSPRRASRSPSFTSGTSPSGAASPDSPSPSRLDSWIDIIALNAVVRSAISASVLPFTAADIIDADAWLIEQP